MTGDRRNDLGYKISSTVLFSLIALLLGIFFNHTYNLSKDAYALSVSNNKDIEVMRVQYINTCTNIQEIKESQKEHRRISDKNNMDIQKILQILDRNSR